jgi:hypothetical protein
MPSNAHMLAPLGCGSSMLDCNRFLDNFRFRKSLNGRFPHLTRLATHWTIWIEPEIGIHLAQQRCVVALTEMDFRQQEMARREIRLAQYNFTSAFLGLI